MKGVQFRCTLDAYAGSGGEKAKRDFDTSCGSGYVVGRVGILYTNSGGRYQGVPPLDLRSPSLVAIPKSIRTAPRSGE